MFCPSTWRQRIIPGLELALELPRFIIMGHNLPVYLRVKQGEEKKASVLALDDSITLKKIKIMIHAETEVGGQSKVTLCRGNCGYIGEVFSGPAVKGLDVHLNERIDLRTVYPTFKLYSSNTKAHPQSGRNVTHNGTSSPIFKLEGLSEHIIFPSL